MSSDILQHAPLTFALAMAAGMVAQVVARHALLPGIVVLLGVGVLLGPDVANVIRPAVLGSALNVVVGFSVAVILFEGGLNLKIRILRKQATPIRRLVTLGALITAAGGALAVRLIMGWDWRLSVLFGTLVIVTGPTVITPLLRQIRVRHNIATILEAEGIFIDAVGATIAIVALEVALAPSGEALREATLSVAVRLGSGAGIGGIGGLVLAWLLRRPGLVPRGFENILALSMAMLLFELSNAFVSESGITAAIIAGMVVGNMRSQALGEIAEFKEQLTVLLIALLFVLLAADVRLASVAELGVPGALTVLALMIVVRPICVALCTYRTELSIREKLFLAWLAPRGIVAAAVASLFALQLTDAGIEGGVPMKALVFLVIAVTVTVQGILAGPIAHLLGVKRTTNTGLLFLGANSLARHLGRRFADAGEEVLLIDSNPDECRAAQEAGLKVFYGNGLESRMLARARAESRNACVALTANETVNMLFAQKIRSEFGDLDTYVAAGGTKVTPKMITDVHARLLFGRIVPLQSWLGRWQRHVEIIRCDYDGAAGTGAKSPLPFAQAPEVDILPLMGIRNGRPFLLSEKYTAKPGDQIELAINTDRRGNALEWLQSAGWIPVG